MKIRYVLLIFIIFLATFLRLYHLDTLPPSPYWEEVALGYDAYSILKTAHDHHGNFLPVVAFESFHDYKPSLYFYATVPSIAIFGLNIWAVRLPSALAGILTVLLVYLLLRQLLSDIQLLKQKQYPYLEYVDLVSALFLAIMPWHILVSRVAFETNLGLFLVVLGSWLFSLSNRKLQKDGFNIIRLSAFVVWGLSMYAYHGLRVFTPLLIISLLIYNLFSDLVWSKNIAKSIKNNLLQLIKLVLKKYILGLIIFIILSLPIFIKLNDPVITQRFAETSAFATLEPILSSNQAIIEDGGGFVAKIIHHRIWYYSKIYIENYFAHFDPIFLFISGDINPRHSIQLVGQLYWVYLPLIIFGLYYLFSDKYLRSRLAFIIIVWLLLAPVASGVTKAVPHALRALPMVIPLAVLTGLGFVYIVQWLSKLFTSFFVKLSFYTKLKFLVKYFTWGLVVVLLLITSIELLRFWDYYQYIYPVNTSKNWQYGYREMVDYINQVKNDYDQIFISREQGRPAMYYWFYSKTDPRLVQSWQDKNSRQQAEFDRFENIYFGKMPSEYGKLLNITTNAPEGVKVFKKIYNLKGEVMFSIWER